MSPHPLQVHSMRLDEQLNVIEVDELWELVQGDLTSCLH